MKKRIFATLIAFTLLFSAILVGCNGTEEGAQSEQTSESEVVSLKAVFESTLKNKLTIDENGELMPPVEFTLECKDGENIYVAAVNSLIDLPEGQDQYYTMMQDRYVCNNVTVEDGLAYVDFSSEGLDGGATTEMVLIDQIVYTLANSFEEIAAVQFTVDGQKTETLMGHIDTSEAFVADYL